MPQTPAWYPGKSEPSIEDDADTLELLALDPGRSITRQTIVVCPSCGFRKEETMPDGESTYFYTCSHCSKVLKPIFGDCCVFCSYGTNKCPPIQAESRSCCAR